MFVSLTNVKVTEYNYDFILKVEELKVCSVNVKDLNKDCCRV
jgi:hypothetical protein